MKALRYSLKGMVLEKAWIFALKACNARSKAGCVAWLAYRKVNVPLFHEWAYFENGLVLIDLHTNEGLAGHNSKSRIIYFSYDAMSVGYCPPRIAKHGSSLNSL